MSDQPGPGEYKYSNMNIGVGARKFSFLQRTKNIQEPDNIMIKGNVPGPGTYAPVIQINKLGTYCLSTTPNSRAANWSPSRRRFPDHQRPYRHIPGPGTYNPSDRDDAHSYVVSNFRNGGNVKFIKPRLNNALRSRTPMIDRCITPGPGTYILPSDFGYLENPNKSPRGSTAGSLTRPRLNFKSQLSTMTGQLPTTRMSDFNTDRNP